MVMRRVRNIVGRMSVKTGKRNCRNAAWPGSVILLEYRALVWMLKGMSLLAHNLGDTMRLRDGTP